MAAATPQAVTIKEDIVIALIGIATSAGLACFDCNRHVINGAAAGIAAALITTLPRTSQPTRSRLLAGLAAGATVFLGVRCYVAYRRKNAEIIVEASAPAELVPVVESELRRFHNGHTIVDAFRAYPEPRPEAPQWEKLIAVGKWEEGLQTLWQWFAALPADHATDTEKEVSEMMRGAAAIQLIQMVPHSPEAMTMINRAGEWINNKTANDPKLRTRLPCAYYVAALAAFRTEAESAVAFNADWIGLLGQDGQSYRAAIALLNGGGILQRAHRALQTRVAPEELGVVDIGRQIFEALATNKGQNTWREVALADLQYFLHQRRCGLRSNEELSRAYEHDLKALEAESLRVMEHHDEVILHWLAAAPALARDPRPHLARLEAAKAAPFVAVTNVLPGGPHTVPPPVPLAASECATTLGAYFLYAFANDEATRAASANAVVYVRLHRPRQCGAGKQEMHIKGTSIFPGFPPLVSLWTVTFPEGVDDLYLELSAARGTTTTPPGWHPVEFSFTLPDQPRVTLGKHRQYVWCGAAPADTTREMNAHLLWRARNMDWACLQAGLY